MPNPILRLHTPLFKYSDTLHDNSIYLFQQWFISDNKERQKENIFVLNKNIKNTKIDKIYLLNERYYTWTELGIAETDKVEQIIIKERLTYGIAWDTIKKYNINGYCIFANLDIFFDDNLDKLKYSSYHTKPTCITGCRLDYYLENDVNVDNEVKNMEYIVPQINGPKRVSLYQKDCKAYTVPTSFLSECSQDVWIIHSKWINYINLNSNLILGTMGCDNKILTYLYQKNVEIINGTFEIPIYHYHKSQYRTYSSNVSNGLYTFISSNLTKHQRSLIYKTILPFAKQGLYKEPSTDIIENNKTFQEQISMQINEPEKLMFFISSKRRENQPFYIHNYDISTLVFLELYNILHRKVVVKDIDSKNMDLFEIILFRLMITVYHSNKKILGLFLGKDTVHRDLDFISSLYSFIQPSKNSLKQLSAVMNTVNNSTKKSDYSLLNHYGLKSAHTLIFTNIMNNRFEDMFKNRNPVLYESFNPILFHNRLCWTHSLVGLKIGVLSIYSKEIKENQANWHTCYENPLFLRNEFSIMELPELELKEIHSVYKNTTDTIKNNSGDYRKKSEECAHELYKTARKTNINEYKKYIYYFEKVQSWLKDVDVVLLDASMLNSFIMNVAMKTNTSCVVLGDLLRLYFGVYTQDDMDWYNESMWVVNNSWKKVSNVVSSKD